MARGEGDHGAALVETALITPILLVLLLAIFEYGILFRDKLTTTNAVTDATKFGAIQGPVLTPGGASADYTVVNLARQNLAAIPPSWIKRVVVFKAGPSGLGDPLSQVPAACKTATSSSAGCNVYLVPEAFIQIEAGNTDYFKCGGPYTIACGWDPQNRRNGPKVGNVEYLGVYIEISRPEFSNLIPKTERLEVAAIQRLEPGQLS